MNPSAHVALVTGASSGIGEAAAGRLASAGWNLALAARRPEPLEAVADQLRSTGVEVLAVPTDVADPAALDALLDTALSRFGRLDVVVNNAGLAPLEPIDALTGSALERVFQVNAVGPSHLIARAWPHLIASGSGCIVNISTLGTQDPFPGFFAYASSKAAVNLMARSCANEGRKHGIRAFAIAPGAVETPMLRSLFDEASIPTDACLSPDDVAAVIMECISGERDEQNGETIFLSR